MGLDDLRPHLHTIPEHPNWIPLRTSYYSENWGFCLAHSVLERLAEGTYEVCIDSSLEPGHLTYAEAYVPGETPDEVLISTYICHPSVCNDGISGIALAAHLGDEVDVLEKSPRIGGLCGTIVEDGFTFDAAGPHVGAPDE